MPGWLYHFLGADGGVWAYLWGGILSILAPLLWAMGLYWWHNICVQHRCIRVGRHTYTHPVTKAQVKACKKHHPHIDHTKPIRLEEWARSATAADAALPRSSAPAASPGDQPSAASTLGVDQDH